MITEPKRKLSKRAQSNPHYVNNVEFTQAISGWIYENRGKDRKEWSQLTPYITDCFLKLIDRYALKGNFRGYTYLDIMKSEAICNCLKYCHNFDINKSQNAFAYFTQYIHNSFCQVLNEEKREAELKYHSIDESSVYNYDRINLYDDEQD